MGKQYLNGVLYSGIINHIGVDEPRIYHADWICTSSSATGTALTETLNLPAGKYIVICHTPVVTDQSADWNNGYLFCLYANGSMLTDSIGVINRTYGRYTAYVDLSEDSTLTFCTGSSVSIPFLQTYISRGGMDAIQIQPYYNLHKYSTTEQVIGTWVDNKPLYEKTVSFTLGTAGSYNSYTTDISNPSVMMIKYDASYFVNQNVNNGISPYKGEFTTGTANVYTVEMFCANVNGQLRLDYRCGTTASGKTAYVTIQYTKTTD